MLPKWGSASALPEPSALPALLPDVSTTSMTAQLNCTKQKLLTYTLKPLLEYNDLEPSLLGKLQKWLVFRALWMPDFWSWEAIQCAGTTAYEFWRSGSTSGGSVTQENALSRAAKWFKWNQHHATWKFKLLLMTTLFHRAKKLNSSQRPLRKRNQWVPLEDLPP